MCGQQGLDSGQVRFARQCRIGYLPQDILEVSGETLLLSVLATVPGRNLVEQEIELYEKALGVAADPEEQLRLAHKLSVRDLCTM